MASLHAELEAERRGGQELRREVQAYVGRVRQVESLLARRDEEREGLLQQLQQLASDTGSFDAERQRMDRTIRGQQEQANPPPPPPPRKALTGLGGPPCGVSLMMTGSCRVGSAKQL